MKVLFSEQEEWPVLTEEEPGWELGAMVVLAPFWKVWLWRLVKWLWDWRHRSIRRQKKDGP